MKKKNILVASLVLLGLVFIGVGGFFLWKNFLSGKVGNKQQTSQGLVINDPIKSKKFNFNLKAKINFGIFSPLFPIYEIGSQSSGQLAYTNDGLKERLYLDKFVFSVDTNGENIGKVLWKDVDLIQILWKKWGYIGDAEFSGEVKEDKDLSNLKKYFSGHKYLYVDDKILYKDPDIAKLLQNSVIKDIVYGLLTPNYETYWKQKKVWDRLLQYVLSEDILKSYLLSQGQSYVVNTDKICDDLFVYYKGLLKLAIMASGEGEVDYGELEKEFKVERCKKELKDLQKQLIVKFEKENGYNVYIFKPTKINPEEEFKIKVYYKNNKLDFVKVELPANLGYLEIDKKGIKNADVNIMGVVIMKIKDRKGYIHVGLVEPGKFSIKGRFDVGEDFISGSLLGKNLENQVVFIFGVQYKKGDFKDVKFILDAKKTKVQIKEIYNNGKGYLLVDSPDIKGKLLFVVDENKIDIKGKMKIQTPIQGSIIFSIEKFVLDIKNKVVDIKMLIKSSEGDGILVINYKDRKLLIEGVVKQKEAEVAKFLVQGLADSKKGDLKITFDAMGMRMLDASVKYEYKDKWDYNIEILFDLISGQERTKGNINIDSKKMNDLYTQKGKIQFNNFELASWQWELKLDQGDLKILKPQNYKYLPDEYARKIIFYNLPDFTKFEKSEEKQGFRFNKRYVVGAVILGGGVITAALMPRITGAQLVAEDVAKKSNLSQIGMALSMYYSDKGEYPLSVGKMYRIADLEKYLVPTYLPNIPNLVRDGYYIPMKKNGVKNAGMVLAVKMNTPKYCNVNIYSPKELFDLTKQNDFEVTKLEKFLSEYNKVSQEGCFYVVIY